MKLVIYEAIKWIFSGIGVLALGWLINNKRNHRIITTQNGSSDNILNKDTINISKLSARKIESEIGKHPPYQQEDIAANYKGIRIRWNVIYKASYRKGEKLRIMCMSRFAFFLADPPWVSFEIELNKYPIFKTIKQETHFKIIGKIIDYDHGWFNIELERFD